MNFSETVLGNELDKTRFVLQNASNLTESTFTLEAASLSLPTHFSLVVPLTTAELNEIKRIRTLATSIEDTWISVDSLGISDTLGNELVAIETNNSLQASYYIEDVTSPVLVDFDLDVDSGILTLVFDETVLSSSLNVTQITLRNTTSSNTTSMYTLTGGERSLEDSTVITVALTFFDLNQIKKIRDLASIAPVVPIEIGSASGSGSGSTLAPLTPTPTEGNTFITITNSTIEDMNSNPVTPSDGKQVRSLTLDTTPPQLVSFDFNLNSEQLILTFTETVDTLTLTSDEFTILGSPRIENYTLTGGNTLSEDDYIIVVQLEISDVNNIKRNLNIAVDNVSTVLYLTSNAIRDTKPSTRGTTRSESSPRTSTHGKQFQMQVRSTCK